MCARLHVGSCCCFVVRGGSRPEEPQTLDWQQQSHKLLEVKNKLRPSLNSICYKLLSVATSQPGEARPQRFQQEHDKSLQRQHYSAVNKTRAVSCNMHNEFKDLIINVNNKKNDCIQVFNMIRLVSVTSKQQGQRLISV